MIGCLRRLHVAVIIHAVIPLVGATLASPALHAQSPQVRAVHEVQPLVDSLMVAANAHDTDRFLTSYLHDSSLVFVFNGVVTHGFQAVRDQQLKAWNNGTSDVVYTARQPSEITALTADVVLATDFLSSRRTLPTGDVRTTDLTVTMVWQKRPEGWRVIQVHESTVR